MRRVQIALAAILVAGIFATSPLSAQAARKNIPAALAGGVAGAASGGYIAISVIVAESRAGKFVDSVDDILGWRSAPVLIGGVTGVVVGATSPDRLIRTVGYGTLGTIAGTGIGAVVGKIVWDGPEAKWAGGAIGAGIGMAIGSSLGLFLPMKKNDDGTTPEASARATGVPLSFTIRF